MVTKAELDAAVEAKDQAEKTINQYYRDQVKDIEEKIGRGYKFTDDELLYSARHLCPCGHGLAYPKGCSPSHYWDCSAILKGIADMKVEHTQMLPFSMYDIKCESEHNGSTRGVFKPKAQPRPETPPAPPTSPVG